MRLSPRLLIVGLVGGATLLAGTLAAESAENVHADTPPSVVETYDHPGASVIFANRGIVVGRGDGHIELADCPSDTSTDQDYILVKGRSATGLVKACFRVTGASGRLSMELPKVFYIEADRNHRVNATLNTKGAIENVDIPKGDGKSVGEGTGPANGPSTLLELTALP